MNINAATDVDDISAKAMDYVQSQAFAQDFPSADLEHPWGKTSVDSVELDLIGKYADYSEVPQKIEWGIVYLIGVGICQKTSGKWATVSPEIIGVDSDEYGLCIESSDGAMHILNSLVPNAMMFRTGEYWSSLLVSA